MISKDATELYFSQDDRKLINGIAPNKYPATHFLATLFKGEYVERGYQVKDFLVKQNSNKKRLNKRGKETREAFKHFPQVTDNRQNPLSRFNIPGVTHEEKKKNGVWGSFDRTHA